MGIYGRGFQRSFFKLSLIGLVFILSCGKADLQVEVDDGTVQWYTKLGFKENMKQIKSDTTLLTRRVGEGDWADAEASITAIKKSFATLNLDSNEIPKEFFELKGFFDNSLAKLLQTCKDKDFDSADARIRAVKKSCSYCHRILRKELDRMNLSTDFDVAMDKYYKAKEPGGN